MKPASASLLAIALLVSCVAGAQLAIPPLTTRVTDQTATLTTEQKATLERTLQRLKLGKAVSLRF